jgi:hypothetical protein
MKVTDNQIEDVLTPIWLKIMEWKKVSKQDVNLGDVIKLMAEEIVIKNDFIDNVVGSLETNFREQQNLMSKIRYKHKKIK